MREQVGFVGLGTMGRPMAVNIAKAGYALKVYNRTGAKTADAVAAGATAVNSPAEAAVGSNVVITMLSDSPIVREAVLGDEGILKACSEGTVIVDMSTISPSSAREIASECTARNVAFLDAPVTGGEKGAIEGTLSVMVGGNPVALRRVRPVLETVSARITYMGESGAGQSAKLCNQVICGLNIQAVCEGLSLAQASGLDLQTLLSAIVDGAAGSWMLSNLGPKMIYEDWAPGFKIALQQKDLRLALEAAEKTSAPLPGAALVQQMFRFAETSNWGEEGTQALYKTYLRLASSTDEVD